MRIAIVILFAAAVASFAPSASARVWILYPDGSGDAMTIQAGIDSCAAGDTVVAMPGIYTGLGNRDIDFLGKAIVVMAASSYDTTLADSSVVDCEYAGRAFHFHSNEDSLSVLEGFVIQRGELSDDWYESFGGGIFCSNASPTILNNRIRECWAQRGAGIGCENSTAKIAGNRIYSCWGMHSGGIHAEGGALRIAGNRIHGNYGNGVGAICCEGGSPNITGNEIYFNDSNYGMGGVSFTGCTGIRVANNYIHGNGGASDYSRSFENAAEKAPLDLQMPLWMVASGLYAANSDGIVEHNRVMRNGGELHCINSTFIVRHNEFFSPGASESAVYCEASSVVIEDNYISGGLGGRRNGLGIVLTSSLASRIANNTIADGDSDYEYLGGIQYDGSTESVIEGNLIYGHYGSGIRCRSSIRIANNVIHSNYGSWTGGGIYCEASPIIEGNTIVGNSSRKGAGIYCAEGSSPIIRNNIIANNDRGGSSEGGEGIYFDSSSITIECNDVFGNEGGNYSGIPDQTGLNGNISMNPIFCDAAAHDYSIHEMSPCAPGNHPGGNECGLIGARGVGCYYIATLVRSSRVVAEQSAIVVTWELAKAEDDLRFTVLRSEPPSVDYVEIAGAEIARSGASYSFRDSRCEPGATYRYRIDAIDETGRRALFETDAVSLPEMPLALHQNHPNPFNPSTTVGYYLPRRCRVRIEVHDVSGRRVATLVDAERERGAHTAVWNGIDERGNAVASGVYFARLAAGKETLSRKMVLLR